MYEDTAPTPRQGVFIGVNRAHPYKYKEIEKKPVRKYKTVDGERVRRRPYDVRDHKELWALLAGVIVVLILALMVLWGFIV